MSSITNNTDTDIDIDLPDRTAALRDLMHVPASMVYREERVGHNSGIYLQDIPVNPYDGFAVYPYEEAAQRGYFKIDMLPNYIYDGVRDEQHLIELLDREPIWELFLDKDIVDQLAHLHEHFSVLESIRPVSIMDLAVCIAIVRPGKRYLIGAPRSKINNEIWKQTSAYHYKKSHAVAYAASIVVQLNLLVEGCIAQTA